jgi:hypothetical protein
MSADEHISALKAKHAELEQMLEDEVNHAHPNDLLIADIKKQKLRIKDELAQLNGQ